MSKNCGVLREKPMAKTYENKGSIERDKDADLIIFDDNIAIKMTIKDGIVIHDTLNEI